MASTDKKVLDFYKKAYDAGDVNAAYPIGQAYYKGEGVEEDRQEAAKWWQKGADAGDMLCLSSLGRCYLSGDGVEKDIMKGICLLDEAADKGSLSALSCLIRIYTYGYEFVAADNSKVFKYSLRGAELGDAGDMYIVSRLYAVGGIVEKDEEASKKWLEKSVSLNHPPALHYMAEIAKTREEAFEWTLKSAMAGNKEDYVNVATMYFRGEGIAADYRQSLLWWKKAANETNDMRAMAMVGLYLYCGLGTEKDEETARLYLNFAMSAKDEGTKAILRQVYGDSYDKIESGETKDADGEKDK